MVKIAKSASVGIVWNKVAKSVSRDSQCLPNSPIKQNKIKIRAENHSIGSSDRKPYTIFHSVSCYSVPYILPSLFLSSSFHSFVFLRHLPVFFLRVLQLSFGNPTVSTIYNAPLTER
jgi:hypothetical protein